MIVKHRDVLKFSRQGFTLLEMVIVLSIIAAIATMVVLSLGNVQAEQRLRESVGSIESLAKLGRNIAVRQQRAYQLTISEQAISIEPKYTRSQAVIGFDEDELGILKIFEDISDVKETDNDVIYEVRRWDSDTWQLIERDKKVVLTIEPTGLVEPISIRCSMGNSWIIQELHPLTAGVRNEEMNIDTD